MKPTVLDRLAETGFAVYGIGKISDIFAGRGITKAFSAHGTAMQAVLDAMR